MSRRRIFGFSLLALAMLIAIAAVMVPLVMGQGQTIDSTPTVAPVIRTPLPSPTPVLTAKDKPPTITATAAYLYDADSGRTLADINGEEPLPMASTTKIMTALIAIQVGNPDEMVTIHQDAINEVQNNNGSSALLVVGDKIALSDLLYGLMLPSGDDAAIAIADTIGGTTANFAHLMNLFAHRLHLYQTHYLNPDGLTTFTAPNQPDPNHYTTALDLVRLTDYAMKQPAFTNIVQTEHYDLSPSSSHHGYSWDNTNILLKSYNGMTGVKTGFTGEAGGCLVFSATRNGHHLIGVVLHSIDADHRFSDAKLLLDWGFGLPLMVPN